jgi:hypothetical protein
MHRARRPDSRRLLVSAAVLVLWLAAILAFSGLLDSNPAGRDQGPPFDASAAAMARNWQGGPGARLGANLDPSELRWNLDGRCGWKRQVARVPPPMGEIEPQGARLVCWTGFRCMNPHPALKPVVVLNRSPEWARRPEDAGNLLAPPKERADFGEFAAQVARRYGGQARYYQVWDEPNIAPHWGARPVDPADYLGLLREAAIQLRANDGDAVVLLGALAPTIETGAANLSDPAYLDALRAGAEQWFDVVC